MNISPKKFLNSIGSFWNQTSSEKDTITSKKEEVLVTKRATSTQGVNPYYQDTQSPYSVDEIQNKISAVNSPSKSSSTPKEGSFEVETSPHQMSPEDTKKCEDLLSKAGLDDDVTNPQKIKENYKTVVSKAGEEAKTAIDETKVKEDGTKRLLDERLQLLSKAIDDELQKDNPNFDFLQALVLKSVMLHMRRTARVEQEFLRDQSKIIKDQAIDVRDSYASKGGLAMTITSAAVSIGSGCIGFAPFAAGTLITQQTAQILAAASQPASNAATGLSGVGNVMTSKDAANKGYKEFLMRDSQSKEDLARQRKQGHQDTIRKTKELFENFHREQHQLFSSFSSPNG